MATCSTPQWSTSYTPQIKLTVTQSSSTNTEVTLSWTLQYVAHGYAASTSGVGKTYSVVIAGETVKSGTYNIDGITGTTTIATGTKEITKTTATQTISFSCSMAFNLTWSGVYGGTKSASGTISVAAKTSYTITYNANGGSGAPSKQTKWYGTAITLSSTKPTRSGYTFQGWATSSGGSVSYSAGASYTGNANLELYAVWSAGTYTVTYNANGGSGAPANQTKTHGATLTLSSTKPTRTNYTFLGWGTSASATTVSYNAGASYTANADLELYAVWSLAHLVPRITNFTIARCLSDGTHSEEGTNVAVSFSWESDTAVSLVEIGRKPSTGTSWGTYSVSASGTSGSVNTVIGNNDISGEYAYDIRVRVKDDIGIATRTLTLDGFYFLIDFYRDGTGVAIGKAATVPNTFDVYKRTIIRGNDDASVSSESGQLVVGDPLEYHLAFDNNEIMAKTNDQTSGQLNLNPEGGMVSIGGELSVAEEITARSGVVLPNNEKIIMKNASGTDRSMIFMNNANTMSLGYGGYDANEGATSLDGYAVNIRSKGAINITSPTAGLSSRAYGVNKILWTGEWTMDADKTASLSEAISAQPHGIVLVWSPYTNGASLNYGFVYHFVPKYHVANHNGIGTDFALFRATKFAQTAGKYLYISDTTIKGFADNVLTGTGTSGIKYTNNYWVLRRVVGV